MNHSGGGQSNKLTGQDIEKHNSKDSCWVIIHGKAYDVTEFLPEHPGGPKIILKYAGKDATEEYAPIHPPDTLDKYLDKKFHLGEVDMGSVKQEEKEVDPDEEDRLERVKRMPILEQCYNLMDFEAVARRVMKKTAWAYYSSGADDEIVRIFQNGNSIEGLIYGNRQCAKTILPSTRSGSARGFSSMLRRLILQLQCSDRKSPSHSMSQQPRSAS